MFISLTHIKLLTRVSETMPLYDLLNEFQKGHSHMAAVVKNIGGSDLPANENPSNGKPLDFPLLIDEICFYVFLFIVHPGI